MPNLENYLANYPTFVAVNNAQFVARFIDEKPSVITIVDRFGSAVAGTQTVRIEPMSNLAREQTGINVVTEEEFVIVHGYKNATGFTNTDLRKGDRFTVDNMSGLYDVVNVVEAFSDRLLVMARVR